MVPPKSEHHRPAPAHRAQGESHARHMHRRTPCEAQTQGGWEGSQTDRRAPKRRQTDRSSRADLNARDRSVPYQTDRYKGRTAYIHKLWVTCNPPKHPRTEAAVTAVTESRADNTLYDARRYT